MARKKKAEQTVQENTTQVNPVIQSVANEVDKSLDGRKLIICPCCGKKTLASPVVPDKESMDSMMACILTGTPYSREYSLYHDQVRITATSTSVEDVDIIGKGLFTIGAFSDFSMSSSLEGYKGLLQLYAGIAEIRVKGKDGITKFAPKTAALQTVQDMLTLRGKLVADGKSEELVNTFKTLVLSPLKDPAVVSGVPISILQSISVLHEQLRLLVSEAAFDKDFWSRIKLA